MTAFPEPPARCAKVPYERFPTSPFSGNDSLSLGDDFIASLSFLLPERASSALRRSFREYVSLRKLAIQRRTPCVRVAFNKLRALAPHRATLVRIKSAILQSGHNLEYVSSYTHPSYIPPCPCPFPRQHQIRDTYEGYVRGRVHRCPP